MSEGRAARRYHLRSGIGYRLALLARINDARLEARLAPLGLSRQMWAVLVMVGEDGLDQPSAIAEALRVDRAAISRSVAALMRKGLLVRRNHGGDGRARPVALTEAGRRALEASLPAAREVAEALLAPLSDEEAGMFSELIDRLLAAHQGPAPRL